MADAAEQTLDLHIVGANIAPLEREGDKRRRFVVRRITFALNHENHL
jgi:hypothetical protein